MRRFAEHDDERCTFRNTFGRCVLLYGHHYEHRLEASIR